MTENTNNNILTDEDLEKVNGGVIASRSYSGTNSYGMENSYEEHECKGVCQKITVFKMYSGTRGTCTICGWSLQ